MPQNRETASPLANRAQATRRVSEGERGVVIISTIVEWKIRKIEKIRK